MKTTLCNLVRALVVSTMFFTGENTAGAVEPPPVPGHEFTFVVLGDSQFHLPNTFNRVIDEVVHLYPAFVIQVGDIVQSKHVFEIVAEIDKD